MPKCENKQLKKKGYMNTEQIYNAWTRYIFFRLLIYGLYASFWFVYKCSVWDPG